MKQVIKVKYHTAYLDGGTILYKDAEGNDYFVDNRVRTTTKGYIYDKYPTLPGAQVLNVKLDIEK